MSKSIIRRLAVQMELKLTPDEMIRLVEWARKENRKPAIVAFTAGAARDCARVFEKYFEKESPKWK